MPDIYSYDQIIPSFLFPAKQAHESRLVFCSSSSHRGNMKVFLSNYNDRVCKTGKNPGIPFLKFMQENHKGNTVFFPNESARANNSAKTKMVINSCEMDGSL